MRPTQLPHVLAASIGLLAACGGEDAPSCPDLPAGGPTLELGGSGEDGLDFEAFDDGSERPLVFGTQGGFHVWAWVRTDGLCEGPATFTFRVFDADTDEMVLFQRQPLPLDPVEGAEGVSTVRAAHPLILCPSAAGDDVTDRPFRLVVEAEGEGGRTATAETTFVPVCDPAVQGGSFVDDCRCLCGLEGCA